MQTFLPYPSFIESAKALDYRRLGKQRVEAFQLLVANGNKWAIAENARRNPGPIVSKNGWQNHPAARMWRGYDDALGIYMNHMIADWVLRGYKNTMSYYPTESYVLPPWICNEAFHASHRSNLLRKDSTYYSQFGWTEPDNLEYVWPV